MKGEPLHNSGVNSLSFHRQQLNMWPCYVTFIKLEHMQLIENDSDLQHCDVSEI